MGAGAADSQAILGEDLTDDESEGQVRASTKRTAPLIPAAARERVRAPVRTRTRNGAVASLGGEEAASSFGARLVGGTSRRLR